MDEKQIWTGIDRRAHHHIPDDLIEEIAERAAEKALEKVYIEVGRNVLKKLAWLSGTVVISVALYLAGKGIIK